MLAVTSLLSRMHALQRASTPVALAGLLALLGLLLSTVLAEAPIRRATGQGHPYTVQAIVAGLAHDPGLWLGHTLWLRAVATEPCSSLDSQSAFLSCASREQPVLLDTESQGAAPPQPRVALPLAWAGLDPLLTLVRRAPLLGRFAPAPQVAHWGVVATYRVRLGTIPDGSRGAAPCYEAVVLDAAR